MVKVAAATSAGADLFQASKGRLHLRRRRRMGEQPILIGLVEALSSFKTKRSEIAILSIGCGDTPYTISRVKRWIGGNLAWSNIIFGAMHFQSINAIGQAGLLIGRDRIIRVDGHWKA